MTADDPEVEALVATLTEHVAALNLPGWAKVDVSAWRGRYPMPFNDPETWICVTLHIDPMARTYEPLIAVESAQAHPENAVRTAVRGLLRLHYGPGAGEIVADALIPEVTR